MSSEWIGAAALPAIEVAATPAAKTEPAGLEAEVVALFDRLRAPLLRYLSSFGFAFQDSEEIVQETFLSLFRHLERGKSRANLHGWLFRVAHNLALKRRYRTGRSFESQTYEITGDLLVDPAPDPESQAVSTQIQQRIMAVVRALPEQDRRCLALRAEGLRYRDIAAILGISLGSVSVSLTRALARISRSTGKVTR